MIGFYSSVLYLISAVLFILSLNGLSHPETSRRGNLFGMIGMGIAVFTTLAIVSPNPITYLVIFLGIAIGGFIGLIGGSMLGGRVGGDIADSITGVNKTDKALEKNNFFCFSSVLFHLLLHHQRKNQFLVLMNLCKSVTLLNLR